ncbi:MAG: YggS family pyridoxal phosphate-dependent enzyme, partial [Fimbriimonadales bacterium]
MTISERVEEIRSRIGETTVVAASKGASAQAIREAYAAGIRHFGENYLQEALAKRDECPSDATWHFIGRLQSNKISKVAASFGVVQTVDSVAKARKLSAATSKQMSVFLEVNIAEEPQKAGCLPGNVSEIAKIVYDLDSLRLIGLMTMGPENPNAEEARPYFIRMRKLIESLAM